MTEQAERPRPDDSLRLVSPRIDDVEARRARASVASKLFGGPREPVRVGRYQVLGRIGTGGMGVVYRAHDPELARDVAVKLMNAEAIGDDQTATAKARLVREARAMARLAHPNVIHVYDVGSVEDGVFIAMELVEGTSLATWLRQAPGGVPRDWREVLRVYIDAGRGLAAAHAAGIVHRDFKPENVLVGSDGRVRVGDFGLAGTPTIGEDPESADDMRQLDAESGESVGAAPIGSSLTRTGALLGTPRYMAPEQEHGALASARSDQFSFCVALYEGLYGRAPFDGDNVARYRRNVRAGRVIGAPLDTKVRGWVFAEILRGLAVDPAQRHPGMEALLDRLERALVDPRLVSRSWVRRVAMSVPLIGVALGIGAWVGAQRSETPPSEEPVALASETGANETPMDDGVVEPAAPTVPLAAVIPEAPKEKVVGPKPSEKPVEKPAPNKKKMHCYFQEDVKELITKSRKKEQFLLDKQGTCYGCRREKRPAFAEALIPDEDCAYKYVCGKEAESACAEPSPG